MKEFTESHEGKIPGSFVTEVKIPGLYLIKVFPKGAKYLINGTKIEQGGAIQVNAGQLKIDLFNPVGSKYIFRGKLLLSDEKREQNAEEMRKAAIE